MVRAPCCEKMGLKKGPWTAEEDQVLVSYIQTYGHGNWRALPKKAGLLRCGKSCRLRWINYLRPDIKRGHFTAEEEDAIIRLHQQMGNKWSAIAAQLPGRTDNEIKNVWHTHLKKRLPQDQAAAATARPRKAKLAAPGEPMPAAVAAFQPQGTTSSSDQSSWSQTDMESTSSSSHYSDELLMDFSSAEEVPVLDDSFWTEALALDVPEVEQPIQYAAPWEAADASVSVSTSSASVSVSSGSSCLQETTPPSPVRWEALSSNDVHLDGGDDMDFWIRVLIEAGRIPE